jgi:hypothetical protein
MNKTDHISLSACNCNLAKASPLRRCCTKELYFLKQGSSVGYPDPHVLGLQDPDTLVIGTDPDPHQNVTDPQHCRDSHFVHAHWIYYRYLLGINHYLFPLLIRRKLYLQDSVHTLTCAIMLLNTDLHNDALQQQQRRMSAQVQSSVAGV